MRSRKLMLAGGGLAVVIVVAVAVWYFVLRSDAPPAVDIEDAAAAVAEDTATSEVATDTTAATDTTQPPAATTEAPSAAEAAGGDLSGTWVVEPSEDSFVGYRVEEELASIGFTEAVGRTTALEATLEIEGSTITGVGVVADMTALRSDSSRRDGALRRQALETESFPTAPFELTRPIDLGAVPAEGEPVSVTASGDMTIHGVTRAVEIAIDAQLVAGTIAVVGSLDVTFADYDIDSPSALAVLSVEDNGVMEFQLLFTRS